jgi:hypothetical protein
MKTKSNSDIITAFTTLIAYFKQFGYDIHTLHSDHESSLMSAMVFLNQQGIKYLTIAPYQHEQKVERYVQTINSRFRSVLSSMKFKLPNKLYAQLFTAVLLQINLMPNSVHPTLTPSIIFTGTKLDILTQHPVPFGTYAALHYAKRVSNKYEPHTDNGILLYLADTSTANMVAWVPGRHTVVTINKYTVIKASASDFGLLPNTNIIESHIPDFLTIPSSLQEGAQISAHQDLQSHEGAASSLIPQNQKLCSDSPSQENQKKLSPTTSDYIIALTPPNHDQLLPLPDDTPYLRRSVRNLRFHQPVDVRVLKVSSGISVKRALLLNEKKTVSAIISEVKNMLDYKVGHYIHPDQLTYEQHKNILRSFMFIKHFFQMARWRSLKPDSSPMAASREDISTTSFRPLQFPYKWYFCYLI